MPKSWPFSRNESLAIIAIGIVTPLVDHRVNTLLFQLSFSIQGIVHLSSFLFASTGGPLLGDLLQTWFQHGAVLAAFLVRRPGAGTLAMTINGLIQVFFSGAHAPHLLYGVTGLGADIVFALFRYRRYDIPAVSLAGVTGAMFWYPIVYFSHYLYLYPPSFVVADLAIRVSRKRSGQWPVRSRHRVGHLESSASGRNQKSQSDYRVSENHGGSFAGNTQIWSSRWRRILGRRFAIFARVSS